MGYDMFVVDKDGQTIPETEYRYWRRNIRGGHAQAERLVELGMASWPTQAGPDFPDIPEGTTWQENEDGTDILVGPGAADYIAAVNSLLTDRRGATKGIAAHKLCGSNDGWWVTAEECREALQIWEETGRPAVDDFGGGPLDDTIPFLQLAAEHHGFRVW